MRLQMAKKEDKLPPSDKAFDWGVVIVSILLGTIFVATYFSVLPTD